VESTASSDIDDISADQEDLYTRPIDGLEDPPNSFLGTVKYLGPSVIISATIVGSGEIILTASLGAMVGYAMLWWVLLSCWSKSILQAELARYIVLSGDTYLRAINRVPGKIRGPRGPFSWPIVLGLLAFIPGLTGMGGLVGGAGQAVGLIFPAIEPLWVVVSLSALTAILLGSGSYHRLESVMLVFVLTFTILTILSLVFMQETQYATTVDQVLSGFEFEFRIEHAVLALAAYGYTGVNSGEISSYTYWCIEKGYPARIGRYDGSDAWTKRAQGWLKVLRTDVWITLLLLTCATIPFYFLGAGVLHASGQRPEGSEAITALSHMFTETLGPWSLWLFAVGAFCILFSSTVAAVAGGARYIPDYLIELGFLSRERVDVRANIIKWYGLLVPFLGFCLYAGFQNPVLMVTISASVAAVMLPVQSGITIYLQSTRLPQEVMPGKLASAFLKFTFIFQLVMALLVIYFVVI
tara:strand:- start:268 stop:1671 length:1404 start_codon:yes stop_codon:yes gene_type:complete